MLEKLKKNNIRWYDAIFMGTAFIAAFLFLSHPDLWETANHSYVLLESIFSGKFLVFYEVVKQHNNSYYYINNAHYNIIIYLLFALWQLPVFICNTLFKQPLNEAFILFWAKILTTAFFVGCGYMVRRLCVKLGFTHKKALCAALFFMFNPIAFFSSMAMGQYDSLCLFFALWALTYYVEKKYLHFSFILGISIVFKFFPLLIFAPLILLAEKRILHLAKYTLCALWLYIPTLLLFRGRMEDAPHFTQQMIDRLFTLTYDTGVRGVSLFTLLYAAVLFIRFVYVPKQQATLQYCSVYIPLAVFGILFSTIYWHPQWLILIIPFMVITTFMQSHASPWFWLDIIFSAGFFMNCFYMYPSQCGAVLFDGGLLGQAFNLHVMGQGTWHLVDEFLARIPYVYVLTPVCFVGTIWLNILGKMPLAGGTLFNKLTNPQAFDKIPTRIFGYLIFIIGFIIMWLVPSVIEWLTAFQIISPLS